MLVVTNMSQAAVEAFGDPVRRRLVELLAERPQSVTDLAEVVPVSRSAVSQHLGVLTLAGLVSYERQGRRHLYRVDPDGLAGMRSYLDGLWTQALDAYGSLVEPGADPRIGRDVMTQAPVVRAVSVSVPATRAFEVFTARIGAWWPLATHSPADSLAADLAFRDGALVETLTDGRTTVWGSVTEWSPPTRLAFTWAPSGGPETEIAVDFEEVADGTRVVLTHTGWERYGESAPGVRTSYDGEHAWGWVLELFAASVSSDGEPAFDVAPLRAAYEQVALSLEHATFTAPPPGEWDARQVVGHLLTNAELLGDVVDTVRSGRPARLHGPEDHAVEAIDRCAGRPYDDLAGDLRRAGAQLAARCAGLTETHLDAEVDTYIEHRGEVVVDGPMTLGRLLRAQVHVHLPADAGQIDDLAA